MKKVLLIVLFAASFLILFSSHNAFAGTETVFDENFDNGLVGWNQSVCIRNDPVNQICQIGQDTKLVNLPPIDLLPNSLPNWGYVQVYDMAHPSPPGQPEVRYQKIFNIATEDDYDVSAWLGIKDCTLCNIHAQLYIDGNLIFEEVGPDLTKGEVSDGKFFRQTTIHLTAGSHDVEMAMFSTDAFAGMFRASFDDILIHRDVSDDLVGGELIPIETTSLILAEAQSFSWMIPVILSGIGIGLFVFRKTENS